MFRNLRDIFRPENGEGLRVLYIKYVCTVLLKWQDVCTLSFGSRNISLVSPAALFCVVLLTQRPPTPFFSPPHPRPIVTSSRILGAPFSHTRKDGKRLEPSCLARLTPPPHVSYGLQVNSKPLGWPRLTHFLPFPAREEEGENSLVPLSPPSSAHPKKVLTFAFFSFSLYLATPHAWLALLARMMLYTGNIAGVPKIYAPSSARKRNWGILWDEASGHTLDNTLIELQGYSEDGGFLLCAIQRSCWRGDLVAAHVKPAALQHLQWATGFDPSTWPTFLPATTVRFGQVRPSEVLNPPPPRNQEPFNEQWGICVTSIYQRLPIAMRSYPRTSSWKTSCSVISKAPLYVLSKT